MKTYNRKYAVVTGLCSDELAKALELVLGNFEGTEYELKDSHFLCRNSSGKYDLLFLFEKAVENAEPQGEVESLKASASGTAG